MPLIDNQIAALFTVDAFMQMASNQPINIFMFNLITNLLIEKNIPYDVSFSSGTRKEAPALQLTIHINPTATLVFAVPLTPGSNAFSPSP